MPNYPGCGYQDNSDINDECNNYVTNNIFIIIIFIIKNKWTVNRKL